LGSLAAEASGNSTLCLAIMHRTIEDSDPCQRGSMDIVYEHLIALYRARFEGVICGKKALIYGPIKNAARSANEASERKKCPATILFDFGEIRHPHHLSKGVVVLATLQTPI
jgi:hypothetical protein